jgi:outer membrane protein assembly factor BamA
MYKLLLLLCLFAHAGRAQQKDSVPAVAGSNIFKRTSFAVIPILAYNRSYGTSAGVLLNAFTKLSATDQKSPPSRSSVGFGYTQNKSWFAMATQRLYINEDKWRVFWALGLGKSNFQFFEETDDMGNGVFVNYQTHARFFTTNVMYNIGGRWYAGLKYQFSTSTTEFDIENKPDETTRLSSWGIPVAFDNRDYVYYPAKGVIANLLLSDNAKWLGSDVAFTTFSVNVNHFISLKNKAILASRFFNYLGIGEVPFIGQKVVGGKDLRGYTKGTYRSDKVMALQTEYRYNFYKKWGMVAFAGIASAFKYNGISGSGLLPAGGAGVRYQILPKQKMNIGVDVAAGKDDWGIYFRIGEAF